MDVDGTSPVNRTSNTATDVDPSWARLVTSGYARPRGATPIILRLVPAFNACTSSNGTHGAPLAVPSCSPPAPTSNFLTFNAPDRPAPYNTASNGTGNVTMKVFCTNAATPPCAAQPGDQQDVSVTASVSDVRCLAVTGGCGVGGGTYGGKLLISIPLRMTDRFNGPSLTVPATATDTPFNFGAQCSSGSCSVSTSADAVLPFLVREQQRAVWAISQVQVYDGGADGNLVSAPAPASGGCPPACVGNGGETVFLRQGLFAP
jgi:hypothetical protein